MNLVKSTSLLLATSTATTYALRGAPVNISYLNIESSETTSSSDDSCTCGNGKAKIWGPGGPHTALIPAAELFNEANTDSDASPIEICYGPEHTWREQALECAGGLMTAAEQQAAGMARIYKEILDTSTGRYSDLATPLTMHGTTIIVPKGNPKGITSLADIIKRDDIGMVVVDGNYHDTLTSGTALWEDIIGRTGKLADTANLRDKICYVASGAGDARNQLMDSEETGCDVWLYWHDWIIANPDKFDEIELEEKLTIYRDLAVMPTTNPDGDVVQDFISFVLDSSEANAAMEDEGWCTDCTASSKGKDLVGATLLSSN